MARPTRFSEVYGVVRGGDDDWFDPLLNQDTRLFVDPFLIFMDEEKRWAEGHARLMDFFNIAMEMLATSGFKNKSNLFLKAKGLLLFPEPHEFCLGTSESSIFGAGTGKGLQQGMLKGAAEAINLGIESLTHFEELALFGEQTGPDRISDMTCDVLKADFIEYTQEVAQRHGIPLSKVSVKNASWNKDLKVWKHAIVELPLNPIASAQVGHPVGVMLTPRRFLRRMPSIDPADFWDFAWSNEAEQLRADFNYEIGRNVDRAKIAKLARRKHGLFVKYLESLEAEPKPPYDVEEDPDLIVRRVDFGKMVADSLAIKPPATEEEFTAFIRQLIENFKQCVEQRGAWRLLWVDDKPRAEKHAQALFQTSAVMACQDRDIDISPESNAGRGPVDFKMSRGWTMRALVELKLAKSKSYWRNLENQTPTYSKAENCDEGYFVVIQYTEEDKDPEFVAKAEELAAAIAADKDMKFEVVFVDAVPQLSASKV